MRKLLPPIYPDLLLSDLKTPADLGSNEKFKAADLADLAQVEAICEGVDGIMHLGGYSVEGTWDQILQANIIGCYNLFEAARKKGVKRVVFASSNHAVGFYPRHHRIGTDVTVRPDSRYGVSKVFGEALGALYADKHGMKVTCLRIGNFGDDAARSPPAVDLAQAGGPRAALPHRPRASRHPFRDASTAPPTTSAPGGTTTAPTSSAIARPAEAEDHREHAMAEQAKIRPDPVGDFFQGGAFCSMEFDGDKGRIVDWSKR